MSQPQPPVDLAEFDWIQLYADMNAGVATETQKEKLYRKIREQPLVPIGCLATATALCVGLWSFRNGRRKMSQYMMRTRVAAQGFTVLALITGLAMGSGNITK